MLGPQGRRGEVLAELHTDFPERFEERRHLSALGADGSRRELQLEEHWFHKGAVVLKFAGVDSITDAEQLARVELQIPSEQRASLEAGAAFVSDLVGCEVWAAGEGEPQLLGVVKDLQFGAGEAPLLVIRRKVGSTEDLLVPYAAEFLRSSGPRAPPHRNAVAGRLAGVGFGVERRRESAAADRSGGSAGRWCTPQAETKVEKGFLAGTGVLRLRVAKSGEPPLRMTAIGYCIKLPLLIG